MDKQDAPADGSNIAVAIKGSESEAHGLPKVIATGRGALAEQILEVAFDQGVKVRTDADLAEILSAVEVESEIPLAALGTVAEILSYVYRSQAHDAPHPGAHKPDDRAAVEDNASNEEQNVDP